MHSARDPPPTRTEPPVENVAEKQRRGQPPVSMAFEHHANVLSGVPDGVGLQLSNR